MADRAIIGSVAVRVIPDLKNFRRTTQAKLDAAEASLDPIDIDIKPDTKGLRVEVKRAVEEADAAAGDIEVDVDIDTHRALASIRQLNKTIASARNSIKLNVDLPDGNTIQQRLKQTLSKINQEARDGAKIEFADIGLKMKAIFNNRELRSQVNRHIDVLESQIKEIEARLTISTNPRETTRLKAKMALLERDLKDITVRVNPIVNRTAWAVTKASLAWMTRPETKQIFVKVNKASLNAVGTAMSRVTGIRMLWDLHKKKFDILADFDKHAPKIATMSTLLGGLAAWLGQAAMDAISVARNIGQIAGAAIALPGALAGAGLAFYAFKTAFADFNDIVPNFEKNVEKMQAAMSKNFWAVAAKPMREMVDTLFPQFDRGMQRISKSAGTFTAAMSKSLQGAFGRGILEQMMKPVDEALMRMSKSTDYFANSLQIILDIGLKQLPAFADSWNNANKSFSDFLTKARDDGSLQRWISNGVQQLKHLGSSLVNIGLLINELGAIAERAGGSTLATIDSTLQKMVAVARSPEFQEGLYAILSAVNRAFEQIGEQVGPAIARLSGALVQSVPQILATLGPALANFLGSAINALASEGFQAGMTDMFRGVSSALATLEPVLGTVGDKLGLIMSIVGKVVEQMAPLLASFIDETAMLLEKVGQPFMDFLERVGPSINNLFQQLGPMFEGLGDGVAKLLNVLGPTIEKLAETLGPVIREIAEALGEAFRRIADALEPILPKLGELIGKLAEIAGPIIVAAIGLIATAFEKLAPVIGKVIDILIKVAEWLQPKIEALLPIVQSVITFIIDLIVDAVNGFVNGLSNIIEGIMKIFNGIIDFVVGVFTGDWSRAWEGIKGIFGGILQAILGLIQTIIFGIMLRGLLTFLTAVKTLWSAGWNAVKNAFSAAWNAIKNLFTTGASNLKQSFSDMVSAIWNAAVGAKDKLVGWAKELPGKMVEMFRAGVDKFKKVGEDLMNGLVRGLEAGKQWVLDKVASLSNLIPDWMKEILDINSPSRVMRDEIMRDGVIAGLVAGIDAGRSDVRKSMQSLAEVVSATEFKIGEVDTASLERLKAQSKVTASLSAAQAGVAAGGTTYNTEVVLNGSNLSANEVAGELLGAFRRAERGGRYGRQI